MLLADRRASLVPGLLVTGVVVVFALVVNRFLPLLSPAVIAVVTGAALANLGAIGERYRPGLQFAAKRVLRAAIVLLGLQIALPQVLALGWQTMVIVVVATGATFTITPLIGRRLGLSPGTSLLVATGVSICGAAAIAAMHDSVDSTDDDAAGALSVVVLYGSAAIVVVPLLASWLGLTQAQLGVWAGAAVHEVAQVAAIGAASGVLVAAVTVKLGRVILLAPIVALTTLRRRSTTTAGLAGVSAAPRVADKSGVSGVSGVSGTSGTSGAKRPPVMPLFVAGFLAMVALRSTGLVPSAVTDVVPTVTNVLMAGALFGLGTGIDLRKLAKGGRAMLLGAIATGLIGTISLAGVALLV
ncbi:YeiH family protein [Nonomuraea sediminis]|uniref:YeiH family protein n=1 Tax=Nonomuraea sediminis TaxID=2835864 RepID=UPI001BDDAE81|nr:putative sulfate exporter family transporter [Nonomuraea sediminis]